MKKENWIFGLSTLSVVISIIAICFSLYRTPMLNFDYMGALVGILSILTTILIGWQIYTFIDIKRHSQDLQKISTGASLEIQRSMAVSENANWEIYHYLLLNKDPLGLDYRFIYHGIACLYHTSLLGDITTCNIIVKSILECIINPESITITKSSKSNILKLISSIKQTEKIEGYLELINKVAMIKTK